ncbi:protein of unknown function [Pararobbsia alpina]
MNTTHAMAYMAIGALLAILSIIWAIRGVGHVPKREDEHASSYDHM